MASRRSAEPTRAPVASERGKLKRPAGGVEKLLQAFAGLQEALPFEQQLAHVLETAREEIGLDRLVLWATAPEGDRLLHVAGSGVSDGDRLSLGDRMEIPLTIAGAMGKVCREKMPLVVDKAHPLPLKLRLKPPYSNIKALRTKSFVAVPLIDGGRALGLLVGDNKYRRTPLPVHGFHLLPVFALHLVTAVHEAQLLTEREAHKRELTQLLEQQTATSEI